MTTAQPEDTLYTLAAICTNCRKLLKSWRSIARCACTPLHASTPVHASFKKHQPGFIWFHCQTFLLTSFDIDPQSVRSALRTRTSSSSMQITIEALETDESVHSVRSDLAEARRRIAETCGNTWKPQAVTCKSCRKSDAYTV